MPWVCLQFVIVVFPDDTHLLFLRCIYSDYSSRNESLLTKSQISSLKVRRLSTIALESFKILNNLTPIYLNGLLTFKIHSYFKVYENS